MKMTNYDLANTALSLGLISLKQVDRVKHGQPVYVDGYGQKDVVELFDIVETELKMKESRNAG